MLVFLLMFLSSLATVGVPVKAEEPYVKVYVDQPLGYVPGVDPANPVLINVTIEVSGIADNSPEGIIGWQMDVTVDPDVLNLSRASVIGARFGYFLYDFTKRYGYPPPILLPGIPDPVTGYWDEIEEHTLAAGGAGEQSSWLSPKLVTLVLYSKSETEYSTIDLINVEYMDALGLWHPVDEVIDGHYNQPAPDLYIEGIVLPYFAIGPPQPVIYPNPPLALGYIIIATVANQGTADAASFNASFTVYLEGEEVPELWRKETIASLKQGETKTVWFYFMPQNYGNYTLTIMADCDNVVVELDETNNKKMTCVMGTIRGDVDGDGDVDRYDLGHFAMVYGRKFEEPPYDPADFDYNGDVDRYDLGTFAMNYGKTV